MVLSLTTTVIITLETTSMQMLPTLYEFSKVFAIHNMPPKANQKANFLLTGSYANRQKQTIIPSLLTQAVNTD